MSNLPRDTRTLIYALIGLAVVIAITIIVAPGGEGPALSIRSDKADGAMALRLWLEQSGYAIDEVLTNPIQLATQDALFILNPLDYYDSHEVLLIRDWVRKGRTLVICGDPSAINDLLAAFSVSAHYLFVENNEVVAQSSPILLQPPFGNAQAEPIITFEMMRPDVIVHAYSGTENELHPVVISFREGRGTVWISGAVRPFTNRGLHDDNSAKLILNMLATVTPSSTIAFDEARHGFGETRSVQAWLFNTPSGWGVLATIVITMLFLLMRGRRFGRAVPIPDERLRREPVEYIRAMANLFRRTGQRTEILHHYRTQLRRRLSERYAVDPNQTDIELVKMIAFRDPTVDAAALRDLLNRLSRGSIGEAELVKAAADVDNWLRRLA